MAVHACLVDAQDLEFEQANGMKRPKSLEESSKSGIIYFSDDEVGQRCEISAFAWSWRERDAIAICGHAFATFKRD